MSATSVLKGGNYEQDVAHIVRGFHASFPGNRFIVATGQGNRVRGKSGFEHQIDVSLRTDRLILLVECKCLAKKVAPEDVLVFGARFLDIKERHSDSECIAILASIDGLTEGASQIAKHFGIEVANVRSPTDYGMKIGHIAQVGLVEQLGAIDSVVAEKRG